VRIVDVPDEGVVLDMDTPEDYEQVLKRAGGVVTDKT
jgi:CTP:molybdopterin cytidylyltransferase MocA